MIFLSNNEIKQYTDNLISQIQNLKRYLSEIVIYSSSSISFNELYNMPVGDIKLIEEVLLKKLKENNQTQYL